MSKLKDTLVKMALSQRQTRLREKEEASDTTSPTPFRSKISDKWCNFEDYPNYQAIVQKQVFSKKFKINNPFFLTHDGTASATSSIQGKEFINFSSYNYLNLNGDPRVAQEIGRAHV